jgi:hypothetical protein
MRAVMLDEMKLRFLSSDSSLPEVIGGATYVNGISGTRA